MFGRGALKRFRPFGAGASSSSASALAASAAAAAGIPPVAAIAAAAASSSLSLSLSSSSVAQRRRNEGGSSAASAAAAEPSGSSGVKRRKFGSSAQAAILESTDRARRQQREREQQAAQARSSFEDEMDPDERQEYIRNKQHAQREFRKRFRERAAREGRAPANGERWTDEEYAQAVEDEAALWFANRRAEQADQNQRRGIVPEDERAPADVPMLEEVGAVANADALDAEVDELFGAMLTKTAEQCDEAKQRMRLSTAQALSTDLLRDVRQCAGDLTMDAIARALNNMGCVRSEFQAMFHEAFIQACLPMSVACAEGEKECWRDSMAKVVANCAFLCLLLFLVFTVQTGRWYVRACSTTLELMNYVRRSSSKHRVDSERQDPSRCSWPVCFPRFPGLGYAYLFLPHAYTHTRMQ